MRNPGGEESEEPGVQRETCVGRGAALDTGGEEESASLVKRETLPDGSWAHTETGERPLVTADQPPDEEEEDHRLATSRFHEDLLHQAGHGAFQRLVLLMCGLGLASDAVELFAIAYVMPSVEQELCLEERQKGWLGISSLFGMLLGGLVWGTLGDHLGRRRALLSALATNAVFGIVSAFMPTYHLFLVTRLCSGIGIGGSLPVVFTYFAEFLVRKRRGHHLSLLLLFWAAGGLFVALMAWGIVPRTGESIMDSKQLHFGSWRVFLLTCSLPAIISSIGVTFLPESPRFLLEVGRDSEALYVYRQIYSTNNSRKTGAEYQMTEIELPGKCPVRPLIIPSNRGFFQKIRSSLNTIWNAYIQMLSPPNARLTASLLTIWATLSFGFYGMTIWFPEYSKRLSKEEFESKTNKELSTLIKDAVFNLSLENTHYIDSHFTNVRFIRMLISHTSFTNCSFWNCTFSDVRSSRTYFHNCDFQQTVFVDTDFYNYKFQSCSLNGSQFFSTKGGCNIDFDISFRLQELFFENLFAHLAMIPGTLISSFVLDKFGRVRTLGTSLFIGGLSVCFFWLVRKKAAVIAFESAFNFISIIGWNALDIFTTEAYPVNIRSTSYGFLSSISRLSAILGNVIFGSCCPDAVVLPALGASLVLVIGALCTRFLPETKDYLM